MRVRSKFSLSCQRTAFTLVEMLVAFAVLVIICALLISLVSGLQGVSGPALGRMDTDSQARIAFGRLSADIQGIVARSELPFRIASSDTLLSMVSEVPADSGDRKASLIFYRLKNDRNSAALFKTGRRVLQRAAIGIDFSQSGFLGVDGSGAPLAFGDVPAVFQPSDSNFDVLAEGIIAFNIALQRRSDGKVVASPPTVANGTALQNGMADLTKVAALVVTITALDQKGLKLLNASQVEAVAQKFPIPTESQLLNGQLAGQLWEEIAQDPTRFSGLPLEAVQALRVYQCFIPLPLPSN